MHQKDQRAQRLDQLSDLMRSIGLPADQAAMREGVRRLIKDLSAGRKEHNAASWEWEAKNQFATQATGGTAVAGSNPGPLQPGLKPADRSGMSMQGNLNGAKPFDPASFDPSAGSSAPRLKSNTPQK